MTTSGNQACWQNRSFMLSRPIGGGQEKADFKSNGVFKRPTTEALH